MNNDLKRTITFTLARCFSPFKGSIHHKVFPKLPRQYHTGELLIIRIGCMECLYLLHIICQRNDDVASKQTTFIDAQRIRSNSSSGHESKYVQSRRVGRLRILLDNTTDSKQSDDLAQDEQSLCSPSRNPVFHWEIEVSLVRYGSCDQNRIIQY